MNIKKLENYSKPILRISISFLFLWFATSQLSNQQNWTSFIPQYILSLGISEINLILFNGLFELILGIFLLIGFYTRASSLILSLHLFFISFSIGYNPLGIRDFVLALTTLSIFFSGPDKFCLDKEK